MGDHNWVQTYTGKKFTLEPPSAVNVCIDDIAHALSNICRFAGHTDRHYSVAQHSIILSQLVAPEHAMYALMHDAPEAYLGDVPSPVKRMLKDYKELEGRVFRVICEAFKIPHGSSISALNDLERGRIAERDIAVSDMDIRLLMREGELLMKPAPEPWFHEHVVSIPIDIGMSMHPWEPVISEVLFLERFSILNTMRQGG